MIRDTRMQLGAAGIELNADLAHPTAVRQYLTQFVSKACEQQEFNVSERKPLVVVVQPRSPAGASNTLWLDEALTPHLYRAGAWVSVGDPVPWTDASAVESLLRLAVGLGLFDAARLLPSETADLPRALLDALGALPSPAQFVRRDWEKICRYFSWLARDQVVDIRGLPDHVRGGICQEWSATDTVCPFCNHKGLGAGKRGPPPQPTHMRWLDPIGDREFFPLMGSVGHGDLAASPVPLIEGLLAALEGPWHGVLLVGDTGTGKTFTCRRLSDLLGDRARVALPCHAVQWDTAVLRVRTATDGDADAVAILDGVDEKHGFPANADELLGPLGARSVLSARPWWAERLLAGLPAVQHGDLAGVVTRQGRKLAVFQILPLTRGAAHRYMQENAKLPADVCNEVLRAYDLPGLVGRFFLLDVLCRMPLESLREVRGRPPVYRAAISGWVRRELQKVEKPDLLEGQVRDLWSELVARRDGWSTDRPESIADVIREHPLLHPTTNWILRSGIVRGVSLREGPHQSIEEFLLAERLVRELYEGGARSIAWQSLLTEHYPGSWDQHPVVDFAAELVEERLTCGERPPPLAADRAGEALPWMLRVLHRSGAGAARADLAGARLRGLKLPGLDLQEADLRKVEMDGCVLGAADLRGARLAGARLRGAIIADEEAPSRILPTALGSGRVWFEYSDRLVLREISSGRSLIEHDRHGASVALVDSVPVLCRRGDVPQRLGWTQEPCEYASGDAPSEDDTDLPLAWGPEGIEWVARGTRIRRIRDGEGADILQIPVAETSVAVSHPEGIVALVGSRLVLLGDDAQVLVPKVSASFVEGGALFVRIDESWWSWEPGSGLRERPELIRAVGAGAVRLLLPDGRSRLQVLHVASGALTPWGFDQLRVDETTTSDPNAELPVSLGLALRYRTTRSIPELG